MHGTQYITYNMPYNNIVSTQFCKKQAMLIPCDIKQYYLSSINLLRLLKTVTSSQFINHKNLSVTDKLLKRWQLAEMTERRFSLEGALYWHLKMKCIPSFSLLNHKVDGSFSGWIPKYLPFSIIIVCVEILMFVMFFLSSNLFKIDKWDSRPKLTLIIQ